MKSCSAIKKNIYKMVYFLSAIVIIFAISAFFMPNLFAKGEIVVSGGINTVVNIDEKKDIDANQTGILFEYGRDNRLYNALTGDFDITLRTLQAYYLRRRIEANLKTKAPLLLKQKLSPYFL
ncbi:MAG: hypothetical protein JRJ49_10925 [Deltaproteobacteria bacterium]|nr:hypothetical protein [Deltaproteobacteria bacterium]